MRYPVNWKEGLMVEGVLYLREVRPLPHTNTKKGLGGKREEKI